MYKTCVAWLSIGLCFFNLASCKPPSEVSSSTDAVANGFRGAVKTIVIAEYMLVDDLDTLQVGKNVLRYTPQGGIAEEELYCDVDSNLRMKLVNKTSYTYDEGQRKQAYTLRNAQGRVEIKHKYLYDGEVMIGEEDYYPNAHLSWKKEYKYDQRGNRVEERRLYANGVVDYKLSYTYTEKNKVLELRCYNGDNSLEYRETYQYDNWGNKVHQRLYTADGQIDKSWSYEYDEQGNETKLLCYDAEGTLIYQAMRQYQYDAKGNWIRRQTSARDLGGGADGEQFMTLRHISYYE